MTGKEHSEPWWTETWRALGGDPLKARSIRGVGDQLVSSALWQLIHGELVAIGANPVAGSELEGRLGLAVLLDLAARLSPLEHRMLVRALLRRDGPIDFVIIGLLAEVIERMLTAWARHLGLDSHEALTHFEITVHDPRAVGTDPEVLRHQATQILIYTRESKNLGDMRLGLVATATWARDDVLRPRLSRLAFPLNPVRVFVDLAANLVLAALRLRLALAARGEPTPVPDPSVMNTSPTFMNLIVTDLSLTSLPTTVPAPRPTHDPEPPLSAGHLVPPIQQQRGERWWVAAQQWSQGRPQRLRHLLELAEQMERSRLWRTLVSEVPRLIHGHVARPQELAQYALALVCDEYVRAYPARYSELLDLLEVDPNEPVRAADTGRLWQMLEPVFHGWARSLDPNIAPSDKGKMGRTLHTHGGILPWDDEAKGGSIKRERAANDTIDAVYRYDENASEMVRKAVYWAATRARNDLAHQLPDSLKGRVRPDELMTDVVVLTAIAAVRFRLASAQAQGGQHSLPSIVAISRDLLSR